MKVVLKTHSNEENPIELSSSVPPAANIPCFQCGICCVRWQPLMDSEETKRIAEELGISVRAFRRKYTRPYPPRPGSSIMKADEKGCVFLRYSGDKALCSIHEFKPEACLDWAASLAKKECQDGISMMTSGPLPVPEQLYDSESDQEAFSKALEMTSRQA